MALLRSLAKSKKVGGNEGAVSEVDLPSGGRPEFFWAMAVPAENTNSDAQINAGRKGAIREKRCQPLCGQFAAETPGCVPVAAIVARW
jgi:hypothetical protein